MTTLDLLLKANIEDMKIPSTEVNIKRLSNQLGTDVIFKLQAVNFDKLEEIKEASDKDFNIQVLIAGVKEPNLKSKDLQEKLGTLTPIDTAKKLLLVGEISELYEKISELSGYGVNTIEEIKKK